MSPEKDEQLCKKYPKIFADRHKSMIETCMCWGFECSDGWCNLIDKLCHNIQSHIDWKRKQRLYGLLYNRALKKAVNGDKSSLLKLHSDRGRVNDYAAQRVDQDIIENKYIKITEKVSQVVAMQVKEKFGGLRFYYYGGDDYISGLVDMAESMSYIICEECGDKGFPNKNGWIRTLCDKHRIENETSS